MIDGRLVYSFSGFQGLFFRSGLTIADLKINGKLPERSDSLMMAEKYGRRSSRHWFKRDVGSGSSSQVLITDFCMTFSTVGSEIGRKSVRGVPEKRWWFTVGRETV